MMHILPSHPAYPLINEVWNMYAMSKNPHMFLGERDLQDYQIAEVQEELESIMNSVLEGKSIRLINAVYSSLDIKW